MRVEEKIKFENQLWNKKDLIIYLFCRRKESKSQISKIIGCTRTYVSKVLDEYEAKPKNEMILDSKSGEIIFQLNTLRREDMSEEAFQEILVGNIFTAMHNIQQIFTTLTNQEQVKVKDILAISKMVLDTHSKYAELLHKGDKDYNVTKQKDKE